jgi:hypothetical protein
MQRRRMSQILENVPACGSKALEVNSLVESVPVDSVAVYVRVYSL